ncbi:MAG: HD domain-containing phosphohydrolase [Desulfatiglandaceae bacterium]
MKPIKTQDPSFKTSFLRGGVARRVLVQFILCTLVPIAILGIISFNQVTGQLQEQGKIRLLHSSKNLGMSIFDRLTFLDNELQNLSLSLQRDPETFLKPLSGDYSKKLNRQFSNLELIRGSGTFLPLLGKIQKPEQFSDQEIKHLLSGKPLLRSSRDEKGLLHLSMARSVLSERLGEGYLLGEIKTDYLLGLADYDSLPHKTELCVLDQMDRVIFCTIPIAPSSYRKRVDNNTSGYFVWNSGQEKYLASFWSIPLKYDFLHSRWTVIMSQPEGYIFSPVSYFKKTFPLVVLLSFLVVVFISLVQIRRTMLPLEELKKGAHLIGMKQFDNRISLNTGDEFEDLAQSFNGMAERLGRQFRTMTAVAEIDRAILSSLETKGIATIALTRMADLFHCNRAGLILLSPMGDAHPRTYLRRDKTNEVELVENMGFSPSDIKRILKAKDFMIIRDDEITPKFLLPLQTNPALSLAVLPLYIKEEFAGVIVMGPSDPFEQDKDNLSQARLLTNQVAVALSNARLLEELSTLSWGALKALARTVDAKSPWTAGHTERVTQNTLRIGRIMGFSREDLKDLHRGGLLHDIGKIGVPAHILDKPGKLTRAEWTIVRNHPRMGAKIIEPIAAFIHIAPMILQHHERFDGRGYPDSLSGDAISLGARVLAVADAYDAMVSDRPYRKGMAQERAVQIIRQEAGRQFDPVVVRAFLQVLGEPEEETPPSRMRMRCLVN